MPKFRITYGMDRVDVQEDVIEAASQEEAEEEAARLSMEIVRCWITYSAEEISDED